jgi:hypothetical protein
MHQSALLERFKQFAEPPLDRSAPALAKDSPCSCNQHRSLIHIKATSNASVLQGLDRARHFCRYDPRVDRRSERLYEAPLKSINIFSKRLKVGADSRFKQFRESSTGPNVDSTLMAALRKTQDFADGNIFPGRLSAAKSNEVVVYNECVDAHFTLFVLT